jgi:subfamily B ATP-binding cassette protein MsbA
VAALSDFNFTFKGGQIYCVCGPSGAGKSTLMNLILGLLPASAGSLVMHGADSDGKNPISYMPQKVQLVADTVAANVAYPEATLDLERVRTALTRVRLLAAIEALPQGLETLVGEGGSGLSGGQAQRVLLARLYYHRRPFVLVDEGTSALDPEVEGLVYALLRELATDGAVVITIAHRLAGALAADQVLLLNHGRLAHHGSPSDVLNSSAYQAILG